MSPWWETLVAKYAWIWIGLAFGLSAKYALLIKRGVKIRARLILADMLLLPMVALIAFWVARGTGAQGELAALFSSFCTVGADRLVKVLTERFLQRVDREAGALADEMLGRARKVVAAEQAGDRVVKDTIAGRAPEEYVALQPHPQRPKQPGN